MFDLRIHHIAGNYGQINRIYFYSAHRTNKRRANWLKPTVIRVGADGYWEVV